MVIAIRSPMASPATEHWVTASATTGPVTESRSDRTGASARWQIELGLAPNRRQRRGHRLPPREPVPQTRRQRNSKGSSERLQEDRAVRQGMLTVTTVNPVADGINAPVTTRRVSRRKTIRHGSRATLQPESGNAGGVHARSKFSPGDSRGDTATAGEADLAGRAMSADVTVCVRLERALKPANPIGRASLVSTQFRISLSFARDLPQSLSAGMAERWGQNDEDGCTHQCFSSIVLPPSFCHSQRSTGARVV